MLGVWGKIMFKVSQSKLNLFRKCHRAYHYRYVEELERKLVARPLVFGRVIHEMIEADARGKDGFDILATYEKEQGKLFQSEKDFYGDIIEDIDCIMVEYFNHWENDGLKYTKINGRKAEHSFEVEISKGIICEGKIDAVGSRNGLDLLVEHKSFGPIPPADSRWRDVQTAVYVRMMRELGWPDVDGLLWDYISSKPPTRPKILKNGKLSTAAIDTLPETVFRVLDKHKINHDAPEARTVLKAARLKRSAFFMRIVVPLKPTVIDAVYRDFVTTAKEVRERHGNAKVRTIGRHCSWCDFEGLCRADLMGGDVEFIKSREYKHREKK